MNKELNQIGKIFYAKSAEDLTLGEFWVVPIEDVLKYSGTRNISPHSINQSTYNKAISQLTSSAHVTGISDFMYYRATDDDHLTNDEHVVQAINLALRQKTWAILTEGVDITKTTK